MKPIFGWIARALLGAAVWCTVAQAETGPRRPAVTAQVEVWDTAMNAAVRELKSNHLAEAITLCEQALTIARELGPRDTHLSRSLVLRAEIAMWEKKNDRAEALFHEAIEVCERALGKDNPELVHPLSSLANYYYFVAPQYEKVAGLFERVLAIVEHAPQRDEHQVIMWSRNLGLVYQQLRQYERAEPCFQRAIALAEQHDPTWVTHELVTSAEFYRAWRKFDRAEAQAQRALELRERALAQEPKDVDRKLDVVVAIDEVAAVCLEAGKVERAEALSRRSLELAESFMQPDQPDLQPRLAALAAALRARGKSEEAVAVYQRLLRLTEKNLGPDSPEVAGVLGHYAAALHSLQRGEEAAALEQRAAKIQRVSSTL